LLERTPPALWRRIKGAGETPNFNKFLRGGENMPVKGLWKRQARWRRETREWINKQPKHWRETCLQISLIAIVFAMALASLPGHAETTNHSASNGTSDAIVEQLKRATQELLDAVARGDVSVWQKYLAEDCIYTDEEGNVKTREDLLKELKPLPKNYLGTIKMGEPRVLAQENVIVLSHRDREELELYGQKLITWFHSTETWAKSQDGQWRLIAAQVMAIPNERKPIAVSPNKLDAYVGQYKLAPDVTYKVTRDGEKLFGQRTGRAREELLPLCVDTFYKKGVWRGEKVFERDAKGRVVRLLDRRENNDLIWKKAQ
jgi:ketosteroid isomerase-like protein